MHFGGDERMGSMVRLEARSFYVEGLRLAEFGLEAVSFNQYGCHLGEDTLTLPPKKI